MPPPHPEKKKCVLSMTQKGPDGSETHIPLTTELLAKIEEMFPHLTRYDRAVENKPVWTKLAKEMLVDVVKVITHI